MEMPFGPFFGGMHLRLAMVHATFQHPRIMVGSPDHYIACCVPRVVLGTSNFHEKNGPHCGIRIVVNDSWSLMFFLSGPRGMHLEWARCMPRRKTDGSFTPPKEHPPDLG